MSHKTYTQVLLNRTTSDKKIVHTSAWIPTEKAKLEKHLQFANNEWVIVEIYSSYPFEHIKKYKKEFKNWVE